MLAKTLEEFADAELAPKAEALDEKEEFNDSAFRKMGGLGLLGITASEEYGGSGMGAMEATMVMDIFGARCASTTLSYLAHSICLLYTSPSPRD